MVAVLIGLVLLGVFTLTGQVHPGELSFTAGAVWVLPWLVGLTVISYVGSYPEPGAGNRGDLGFAASALLMALLSVAVYVLAYRFRLSPEEAARHIADSEDEAQVTEEQLA